MTLLSVLSLRILNQLQLVSPCQALQLQLGGRDEWQNVENTEEISSVSVRPSLNNCGYISPSWVSNSVSRIGKLINACLAL